MAAKINLPGLIPSSSAYLRSAKARFPLSSVTEHDKGYHPVDQTNYEIYILDRQMPQNIGLELVMNIGLELVMNIGLELVMHPPVRLVIIGGKDIHGASDKAGGSAGHIAI